MAQPLHVREVIDQAIRENRFSEWLMYGFALVFVALGVTVLIWGLIEHSVVAWAGVAESILFVPAVVLAMRVRHQNTALRLLEVPLRKTKNSREAAAILIDFFSTAFSVRSNTTTESPGVDQ